MKLNKRTLNKLVGPPLIARGFTEFKDSICGTSGLFVKQVDNGLYLSLGLNIHRFYDSMFTCDLYLSRTTRIYSCWGDIPSACCTRLGQLLNSDELLKFSSDNECVRDLWWDASNGNEICRFFEVLDIAIARHIANDLLIASLQKSEDLTKLCKQASSVIEMIRCGSLDSQYSYHFIPDREIDGIPMEWFCAAEIVLRKDKITETKYLSNLVKQLAADAYRQYVLTSF